MKVTFKATRELTSLSCFATNKVMDDQKVDVFKANCNQALSCQMDHLAASSTVNVKYKPEIVVRGLDIVYIVLGDDFALNCSYNANPSVTAKVVWYKNGKRLDYKQVKMRNLTMDGSVIKMISGKIFSRPPQQD